MSFLREEARVWLAAMIVVALYLMAQGMADDTTNPQPSNSADIYRSEQ